MYFWQKYLNADFRLTGDDQSMVSKQGNIQHVEINVSNFERSKAFYQDFLGWVGYKRILDEKDFAGWEQWRSQDFRDLLGALQGFRIPSETGGIEPHCLPGEIESRCGQTSQRISCSEEHQGALWWAERIS